MRKLSISLEEKSLLESSYKRTKSPVFRQRISCILLASNLGLSVSDLAKHFSVTGKTIYHWFNLWEQGGIDNLVHRAGQGCKKKLASVSQEDLKNLLEANSQNLKEVLSSLRSKYQLEVSKKTLIRFLKR